METIIAYTAGEAQGNPGPSAAGVYITNSADKLVYEVKESIGNAKSSFAEYYAVMLALQTLKQKYEEKTLLMQFEMRLSSESVKKQLNGELPITEPGLVPMFIEIHNMRIASFPNLSFVEVLLEENKEALRLTKEALLGR